MPNDKKTEPAAPAADMRAAADEATGPDRGRIEVEFAGQTYSVDPHVGDTFAFYAAARQNNEINMIEAVLGEGQFRRFMRANKDGNPGDVVTGWMKALDDALGLGEQGNS